MFRTLHLKGTQMALKSLCSHIRDSLIMCALIDL